MRKIWDKHASCCAGRDIYIDILRRMDIKSTSLMIFPENDPALNYYGLLYLDEYLLRRLKAGAYILSSDPSVAKAYQLFSRNVKGCELVSERDITDIISFYQLIDFEMDVSIVSLDLPPGRKASNLLGAKDLSLEQLVAIGIYFIIPFEKLISNIEYDGNDSDILKLLLEGYNQ